MLGNEIAQETGKVTGFRILCSEGPKVEVSIRTAGKILGVDYQGRTTYTSEVQSSGFLFGDGQGVYMSAGGMAVWKGQGSGKFTPGGGVSYRGAIHFVSATGNLAKLAGMAAVFEHDSNADDNVSSKLWEWK